VTYRLPPGIEEEARARITWGEGEVKAFKFLRSKRIKKEVALVVVAELMAERRESIRLDGWMQVRIGIALVVAPFAVYGVGRYFKNLLGDGFAKGLILAVMVLVAYGIAKITRGLMMVYRPAEKGGDLSNADDMSV